MRIISWVRKKIGIFDLSAQIAENKNILCELNWANVFNSTIVNSRWLLEKSFSPGRFSIGYPLFYVLYRILDEVKPKSILEFGLGQSSRLFHQYAEYFNEVAVTTLENDLDWMKFFMNNKMLPQNAVIKMVENKRVNFNGFETLSIGNFEEIVKNNIYDLILVDAPWGSERFSRSQVLSLLPLNINKHHFIIIMDDYQRQGERDTCNELEKVFGKNYIEFKKEIYAGSKEFVLYCSPDLRFLLTL